jgi:hypothetical protein
MLPQLGTQGPARGQSSSRSMRHWKYRILPLLARDGMSFEVVVASETEANARRQVQATYPAERFQTAFLGEVR